ncbi:MAG: NUDIX hydrolase [Bryobacteraceae bacterium]|jgi:ADP-ribose pyrophosphatase
MKLISSRVRYRCSIFTVTEDHAIEPGGFQIRRAVVNHGGSAVMMPVDENQRLLLVRQYRLPARASLWEFPAGRVDPGETLLAAARRELLEETGYRARKWKRLASFYASPGYVSEKMTIFLATGLTAGQARPMEDEKIHCRWFTAAELDGLVGSGKIVDAKTLVGFLAWKRYTPR